MDTTDWTELSAQEKKERLFQRQVSLLKEFLANGAITPEQYNTSLRGLQTKMGMK